ncbi:MAG: hypothetical protein ACRCZP_17660 [Phycicoccus sp.]
MMGSMVVTVARVRSRVLRRELRRWLLDPGGGVRRDLDRRGRQVRGAVRAPVDTGLLASTLRGPERGQSRGMPHVDVTIGRRGVTPYLGFVIGGTRPHLINARAGKALRFTGRGGQVIYRRSVRHPGTAANPFLRDALRAARP